ncbi:phenylalanine--tRNA ligase subunit beta [Ruthenibacterium sp. CLA-JM-H11]|uniref:Phenylalanine--tRNA ligase beta subunit n=1 Tax=Ruthenibacterium intestinale TaxID=3133163 RepID=A0ABV1GCQ2_9FIRM
MKMPLGWAKEFAKFECTPHEYAERMTMSGSKVETYECEADQIKNVVVGKILSIVPHPDSDHMVVCQVDVGQDEPVQIVTGAGNLKVGDLVPAALHKSLLPGGKEIRKGKLRGVESNGMLCSLSELGLTKHDFPNAIEDGIMVLDEEWPTGTPIVRALGLDDVSVDFEITPNRPDCLSVRGLGRETAATFGVPFMDHVPEVKSGHGDVTDFLKVDIENADLCYRYVGAVVENVRVKPSPRWMRERLRLCGVRPINNLVDITNYVMLEYGQPMHCFDYKYVNGGHITVRNARPGEEIETLDGVDRVLSEEMLVIADEKGPIAVAGVMGGEFSGVYDDTTTIVFESAMFNGPSVRTTAKKLGMRTEASGRYEKGLDPNGCLRCLQRALELVQLLDAGDVVNGVVDVWTQKREERRVLLRPEMVNKLLGTNLDKQQMIDILLPLGFVMDGDDVIVPSDRWDVERDCDIAEEVARYVGYNKMPSTIMTGVASARPTERQTFREKMLNTLVGYGLYEVETFSFFSRKSFDAINLPQNDPLRKAVVISNPLGEDTSIMRTTALPSVMDVVTRNYNARAAECAVFEDATVYLPHGGPDELPDEVESVVLAAYGQEYDYLALKGMVEKLLETAGVKDVRYERNAAGTTYHPGRCADIYLGDEKLGVIGELHPTVLGNYGVKPRVVAAELNMDVLFAHRGGTALFQPLPKHPATARDLALVADLSMPAAQIAQCIEKAAGKLLESLTLFDVYTGEHMAQGKKSLAYNLVLRAPDRTLTDEETENIVQKVLKSLAEIQVVLRS